MAQETMNSIHRRVTLEYLDSINASSPPSPQLIEEALLDRLKQEIDLANAVRTKDDRLRLPQTLSSVQIAQIMAKLHNICKLSFSGDSIDQSNDLLAVYQAEGENTGTYTVSEDVFRQLARQYNYGMREKDFCEIMTCLRDMVPRRQRCMEKDLIAVNNGIFDFRTKTLMPFSPDYVFLAKSHVNYNPHAVNPVIQNPDDNSEWDVESWMQSLSDDPEILNVLWEILGAIIRPNVRWNKSAWMYSEQGNNGKGTLCELMRNICGPGTFVSIPISDFSKEFMLEPLLWASAIIVDENDVGTYIDKAANLKAVITNDVIQINRKFKMPISYKFSGFMVQCLNEFPRIKDRSNSVYRRQLFIPMTKCFSGQERKYIKDEYLHRTDVLEYVIFRVLHMNYYELSEPAACKDVLNEYKEFNDPVQQFWNEFRHKFVWDLLPFTFLYDLYTAWFRQNMPSGSVLGRTAFIQDLISILSPDDDWLYQGKSAVWTGHRMDKTELLIKDYNLSAWTNELYRGENPNMKYRPERLSENYRGLVRK